MTINIKGTEYDMATTLRVAYKVQGQHNHEPYSKVFEKIGDMTVEQQLGILYCSFECANPEVAKQFTQIEFINYCLDNMNLKDMLDKLKELVQGIMGTDETESSQEPTAGIADEATPL